MVRLVFVLGLAGSIGTAALADSALLSPTDFAAYIHPKLPMRIDSGLVTAITAEGQTLVWHLEIDNPALDVLRNTSDEGIAMALSRGWCEKPEGVAFFRAGYILRWDISWRGQPVPRRVAVHSCK